MSYKIHSLFIYPIKSLQGISLEHTQLCDEGFKYDRQWMLVDEQGQFLSQRQLPQMATLKTRIQDKHLIVSTAQGESLTLALEQQHKSNIEVTIWGNTVNAYREDDKTKQWFSKQLGTSCQLVRLALNEKRLVDKTYALQNEVVGFADGFPLLVVAQSNIELLNSKLETAVSMARFRPNIVIDGLTAHAEDDIQSLNINNIEINLVKPCSRCVIPSIHPSSGDKRADVLRALIPYRRFDNKIYFGMNAIHRSNGMINVSDTVNIQQNKSSKI